MGIMLTMNVENITHIVTKSETCLIESYNLVLRTGLARLHRKTKCYSKSSKCQNSLCSFSLTNFMQD
ncbi:MAG: IS1 family transposase [Alphaproteobacteria bacterium]|nr:IS1 family transposase [Alphaproteobacteria bacterium]